MASPAERPPEPAPANVLTRDPVRLVWVAYGLVQAVVIVLMAAELINPRWSSVVTGIALACYVAVSELFVKRETAPIHH
jgi:membrane protein YdbS with pleckstrin-like domain